MRYIFYIFKSTCYSAVCDGVNCLDKAIKDKTVLTCSNDPAYGCAVCYCVSNCFPTFKSIFKWLIDHTEKVLVKLFTSV